MADNRGAAHLDDIERLRLSRHKSLTANAEGYFCAWGWRSQHIATPKNQWGYVERSAVSILFSSRPEATEALRRSDAARDYARGVTR
ncbi:hypothetical protein C5688_12125 [Methylocystis sp. MitZ-2018]|nr:hypothetical protein C5688_12125 [Methylocystis sp. MitZ-2018]